jgi:hypothetical protein
MGALSVTKVATVKHFLFVAMALFQIKTVAQSKCESVFLPSSIANPNNGGVKILLEKDSKLHTSEAVERIAAKYKYKTKASLTKPADKLDAWLNSLTRLSKKSESSPRTLGQVKVLLQNQYVIKYDEIPQSFYDLQVRIARERGHGEITLNEVQRRELADNIIADQKRSLDSWTEYLVSKDADIYPMWLKYWIYTGMIKLSKFDSQSGTFGARDKGTVAPFPELNHEALGLVVDQVLKYSSKKSLDEILDPTLMKHLPGLNFGKLYGRVLQILGVGQEGAFMTNQGVWVMYPRGSDHMPLVKSLDGRNSGWCTTGEAFARAQLDKGDFHVYYSLDQNGKPVVPRLAIRMDGDIISEVRGVSKEQNLDPQIQQSTVLSTKMKEFGARAEEFFKREHDMKLLTHIETKHNLKIQLNKEELRFLYELDTEIDGFGKEPDPRIALIKATRDTRSDLVIAYDHKYTRDQITTNLEEYLSGNSIVHYGDLDLRGLTSDQPLKLPEIFYGAFDFDSRMAAQGVILPKMLNRSPRGD